MVVLYKPITLWIWSPASRESAIKRDRAEVSFDLKHLGHNAKSKNTVTTQADVIF